MQASWFFYRTNGRSVSEISSPSEGLKMARGATEAAKVAYGPQAGCACYVVALRGSKLSCGKGSGGLCLGRSFAQVGCQIAVDAVAAYLAGRV